MKKLVLVVIDAMKPSMLRRAMDEGRAPTLAGLASHGHLIEDCVAAFPSVTPVCAASIATGVRPDAHDIPAMNWWHRGEERYVEYGTSFGASRTFGIMQSLTDTVYNMNSQHLATDVPTVFERLDDAGVRTAGTTYLMYRGRYEHHPNQDTALARIASTMFNRPVFGPRELFYADLIASRRAPCRAQFGLPGVRDQHAGCVGEYLTERDLFDFLLFSLPDNDSISHRRGPAAQVSSIAHADTQLARLMEPAGGLEAFLEDHAVVVCSDHSQSAVADTIDLFDAFEGIGIRAALRSREGDQIAICPNSRAAQVYVLDPDRRARLLPKLERQLLAADGVDLIARMTGHPDGEASVRRRGAELRFAPRGEYVDRRGASWSVDGDLSVLGLSVEDGVLRSDDYPDALTRLWSALRCRTSGELLASASPGYEFRDWGGSAHVGGGSHGSLHRNDSHGTLLWAGLEEAKRDRDEWSLCDIVPMVARHFDVAVGSV